MDETIRSRWMILLTASILLSCVMSMAQEQGNPPPPPPPSQDQPNDQYQPPPPPPAYNANQGGEPQSAPPPPSLSAGQLNDLVSRIALYPDPLLAQVLTASTYPDQIPDAAAWANQHQNLNGDALAEAIREDNLPWDASVLALLPFPSVLDMMAQNQAWTQQLGDAVLANRAEVMDAVQNRRREAYRYGYLRPNAYDNVTDADNDIEILPTNPAYLYVPTYDPFIVFGAPRPGFYVGGAIRFGPAIVIGPAFFSWGWAHPYFAWRTHGIFFDATPWGRSWVNRGYYVHPYARPYVRRPGPRVERHDFRRR